MLGSELVGLILFVLVGPSKHQCRAVKSCRSERARPIRSSKLAGVLVDEGLVYW